ncbi:hypothetical protein GW17_00020432 [Ensete ventricosum]|nr:hypothetical protein GW17_00020432 [Ensete ventricosum]RZS08915.1 hypothetical protein BHM03_00039945 [Ensete ventricosum]
MVLLDKIWDDVVAGPPPERGLGKLRKVSAKPLVIKEQRQQVPAIPVDAADAHHAYHADGQLPHPAPGQRCTVVKPRAPIAELDWLRAFFCSHRSDICVSRNWE